jgi:hypothetical protein
VITGEQWLTWHRLCLDAVRSAIQGLTAEQLAARPLPGDDSIGEQVCHLIGCEGYWLREVQIEPQFDRPPQALWAEQALAREFDRIQRQYEAVLADKGLDRGILFGLGRASQHALYHYGRIVTLRRALDPKWQPPEGMHWEETVDYGTRLLIDGTRAETE